MTDVARIVEEQAPPIGRARRALLRRLIDVVALPSSRLPHQDRTMASDILMELLFNAPVEDLELCAQRLAEKSEAPRRLLRFLSAAPLSVSRLILEENTGVEESDLAHVARVATAEHREIIAQRKNVGAMLADTLIDFAEPQVVRALLRNRSSALSDTGLDALLELSRTHTELCPLLVNRPELSPGHAMVLFWWSDSETRRAILSRHAAERVELISVCSDVFAMMAEEGWKDPASRKALQLIERRQRNRAAIEKSDFVNLEHAIEMAEKSGMTSKVAQEIGYLAGVKPITIAKILSDKGGEGLAVLCKATGLKHAYLKLLWKALKRQVEREDGTPDLRFRMVLTCYDTLTVAKAQTVLRYWNWSLSSAYSPRTGVVEEAGSQDANNFSAARKTAGLLFGRT